MPQHSARRAVLLVLGAVASVLALHVGPGVGSAAAQDVAEIVDQIDFRDYYLAPSLEDDVDIDALERALAAAGDVVVVVLDRDPAGGADLVAEEVRAAFADDLSVLVITPGEVGGVSDVAADAAVNDGLDAVIDRLDADGDDIAGAVAAFDAALGGTGGGAVTPAEAGTDGSASAADGASAGGGGGGVSLLVVLLVIVALIGGAVFLLKRKAAKVDARDVEAARVEIRSQLSVIAAEILDNEGRVEVSGNAEAIALFREANATYSRAAEEVETTTNLLELARLNDEVDRARWQIESAEALVEGRTPPPEPKPDDPAACFFDPTHRPGTEEATLRTSAGEKQVRVCMSCARRLERGEKPEPRMIDVGGRRMPAAAAPRSHGGLGMGGLSAFEIILGGLGALGGGRSRSSRGGGLGIDWGDMLPGRSSSSRSPSRSSTRGGSSSSPFGIDRLPSRPRGLPTTRASRPTSSRSSSSGRRTRSSSPKRSAAGRGRRRR